MGSGETLSASLPPSNWHFTLNVGFTKCRLSQWDKIPAKTKAIIFGELIWLTTTDGDSDVVDYYPEAMGEEVLKLQECANNSQHRCMKTSVTNILGLLGTASQCVDRFFQVKDVNICQEVIRDVTNFKADISTYIAIFWD